MSAKVNDIKRINSLDWLRGLLALSILLYHTISWETGELGAQTLLGKLGIYGVSMFFVLSGLSMALVYHRYITDVRTSIYFFIRRIARIWPLMWFTVLSAMALALVTGGRIDVVKIVLNLTTLFGFVKPDAYMITGAWSIGNEMVYYALTPLIIMLYNKKKLFGNLGMLATLAVAGFFSVNLLDPHLRLQHQWEIYINPFNNLFLYYAGIAMYYNFRDAKTASWILALLAAAVAFFTFYPVSGDSVGIVTGLGRPILSLLSMVIVFCFFKFPYEINNVIGRSLSHLGTVTYGVYLLHPLVYQVVVMVQKRARLEMAPYLTVAAVLVLTVLLALVVYHAFEIKFIRLGKRWTQRTPSAM